MLEISNRLYEAAGRMVAPLLHLEQVGQISIRRSVAAREAPFPWSDLDLGLVIRAVPGLRVRVRSMTIEALLDR